MTVLYGQYKEEKHPLAARIWGHRLRTGQHWMEYMLEFLSVLAGFDYHLGQGLSGREAEANYRTTYRVPHRLGLRRFVFYDERERTRNSLDSQALDELRRRLASVMPDTNGKADDAVVDQVRSLLRSFAAIEEARSWYAKSLFPIHETFLLWEGQRKGATLREDRRSKAELIDIDQLTLDRKMEFTTRNFFARGGELYYLIISAGTEGRPELRATIAQRLRALLTEQNQGLGRIAQTIDHAWTAPIGADEHSHNGTLGWILDPECALYRQIADDLANFLDNDLDSIECLELLAHLIGFHIICYIYHRAHPASHAEGHASGSCQEACRPQLLIDLLGEQDGGVLREQSAGLLRQQDDCQLSQARAFIAEKVHEWYGRCPAYADKHEFLSGEIQQFFQIGQTRTRGIYDAGLREIRTRYVTETDSERLIDYYSALIFKTLDTEFRKNFLGVHRKIGRSIGLIAPRKGPEIRFVLGDTLLKTLTMAILGRNSQAPFGTFLEQLYTRYGIIIGPGEARAAELMSRLRINEEYYARNRVALLQRMQRAGLLTQYSDATAIVRRR